jgi:hypothetical protein
MFRPIIKIIHDFKYSRRVYFNDGREPMVQELIIESEVGFSQFKLNLREWNRQGQQMKEISSKSHIEGYDYWITVEQEYYNSNLSHRRKECLELIKSW